MNRASMAAVVLLACGEGASMDAGESFPDVPSPSMDAGARDAGRDAASAFDASGGRDATAEPDAPSDDAGIDAASADAGFDAGPCVLDADCDDGDPCTSDACVGGACVFGTIDADGDSHISSTCGGDDCDDASPARYTGAPELCNGADDDCDGADDEGFPDQVCGTGACGRMIAGCLNGSVPLCEPGTPGAEQCGNGMDDDCDGRTDEIWDGVTSDLVADTGGFPVQLRIARGDGLWSVLWTMLSFTGNPQIELIRVRGLSAPVVIDAPIDDSVRPALAYAGGRFGIAWVDEAGVACFRTASDGPGTLSPIVPLSTGLTEVTAVDVVANGTRFDVVWDGNDAGATPYAVRMAHFDSAGTLDGPYSFALSAIPLRGPRLAIDGTARIAAFSEIVSTADDAHAWLATPADDGSGASPTRVTSATFPYLRPLAIAAQRSEIAIVRTDATGRIVMMRVDRSGAILSPETVLSAFPVSSVEVVALYGWVITGRGDGGLVTLFVAPDGTTVLDEQINTSSQYYDSDLAVAGDELAQVTSSTNGISRRVYYSLWRLACTP